MINPMKMRQEKKSPVKHRLHLAQGATLDMLTTQVSCALIENADNNLP